MIDARLARPWLAPVVLALTSTALAFRFGGFHPRHAGVAVLALAAWACVAAARGRLSRLRSLGGFATVAMVALAAWTTASIGWAEASRHDAWVEALRATGYAAAFVVGGAVLASARAFARFAVLAASGITVVGGAALVRMLGSDPLEVFVAGRLDWPIGYAPGMAGMCLFAMLLLLGVSVAQEQRWIASRAHVHLAGSAVALGAAGLCATVAVLAQSRGTVPALLVGVAVSLVAIAQRSSWALRLGVLVAALLVVRTQLAAPYGAQFDLRQAPFTEGADEPALLAAAEAAARSAAVAASVVSIALLVAGLALVPIAAWLAERIDDLEARAGAPLVVPVTATVIALVVTLGLVGGGRTWVGDQWRGCVDPPERVDDPGSSSSYFANSGTGRCDYYRVALQSVPERPVLGLGAGNFRVEYVRERETAEDPRVVHSLPLQLVAELGLVGAALGAVVLGCVLVAVNRFRASGPARDATFAGAIGALGYWTAHASIDWLWQLPAVTLPAVLLAGGLVALVSPGQGRVRTATSAPFAAAAMLACVAIVLPPTMADRALRQARDPQRQERSLAAAVAAAREAQSFDPTWAEAAITEGALQFAGQRPDLAAEAGRRAAALEPRSWSVQYRASGLIGLDDAQDGRAAFLAARRLNPQLPEDVPEDDVVAPDASPDALQGAGS